MTSGKNARLCAACAAVCRDTCHCATRVHRRARTRAHTHARTRAPAHLGTVRSVATHCGTPPRLLGIVPWYADQAYTFAAAATIEADGDIRSALAAVASAVAWWRRCRPAVEAKSVVVLRIVRPSFVPTDTKALRRSCREAAIEGVHIVTVDGPTLAVLGHPYPQPDESGLSIVALAAVVGALGGTTGAPTAGGQR